MNTCNSGTRIILHIDVNSAYLSWEAAYRLQHGVSTDLRDIPSVVGGDEENRHGIVLAKSIPAKKRGIHTGEVLWQARSKCPELVILPPDYSLYIQCSNALMNLLSEYSPLIERYSIDECFLDITDSLRDRNPFEYAVEISKRVKNELGFTVNIGISTNKLLAKMGSELEKPDKVHTLFPHEIPNKMWPLSVKELFMVGRSTAPKLYRLNIFSIGQLAHSDPLLLTAHFKSFGKVLWQYANGMDESPVNPYLLSLVETASSRLRSAKLLARVVAVSIRKTDLSFFSHQRKLLIPTDNTSALYNITTELFNELWDGAPLRHFGVAFSSLCNDDFTQVSFFDEELFYKRSALDSSIDYIRSQFGNNAIVRGSFVQSGIPPLIGGVMEDFPGMRSLL